MCSSFARAIDWLLKVGAYVQLQTKETKSYKVFSIAENDRGSRSRPGLANTTEIPGAGGIGSKSRVGALGHCRSICIDTCSSSCHMVS